MKKRVLALFLCLFITIPIYSIALDQATFKVGKRFFDQGLYTEAEQRFLDIVKKYPDSTTYHQSLFYLGQSYANLGKYKPALHYYRVLLDKSKTIKGKQQALLGIAKSWLQLGVHDKAGDFFSFFASEHPESEHAPAALYFAGISRERENKIDAALEKYKAVLDLYPNSDYYSKSIEKVAVLGSDTPESLWEDSTLTKNPKKRSGDLFEEDGWEENPELEPTDFRAQSSNPTPPLVSPASIPNPPMVITQLVQSPPMVITQLVQSPPTVITQLIQSPPKVITQQIAAPNRKLNQDLLELEQADVVFQVDGQYIPAKSVEETKKQRELEAYKQLWEKEYKLKIKEQALKDTQQSVKDLAQLSTDKAQILQIKEASLKEKQNRIHNSIYNTLTIEQQTNIPVFDGPPSFVLPSNIPTPTNTNNIIPTPQIIEAEEPMIEDEYADYYNEETVYDDYGDYDQTLYEENPEYVDDENNYNEDYTEYEEYAQ